MAFATPALCGPDYAGGISGNDVQRLIIAALKAAGRPAVGVAAPLRGYPGCDGTPQVSAHRGDWGTVDLTCPAPHWVRALRLQGAQAGGWSVDGREGPSAATRNAVVLTHSLGKGATLQPGDLRLAEVSGLGADTIYSDPARLIGRVLTVNLGEGQSLQPRHLAPDYQVRRGGPVAITVQSEGVAIGMAGLALQDGEIGDVVLVRNLSSDRELRAIVAGPQIVTVQPNIY